jgi:hypothetical protein
MKLDDDAVYVGDAGHAFCGRHAGHSARNTGHDISGQRVLRLTASDRAELGLGCEVCTSKDGANPTDAPAPHGFMAPRATIRNLGVVILVSATKRLRGVARRLRLSRIKRARRRLRVSMPKRLGFPCSATDVAGVEHRVESWARPSRTPVRRKPLMRPDLVARPRVRATDRIERDGHPDDCRPGTNMHPAVQSELRFW